MYKHVFQYAASGIHVNLCMMCFFMCICVNMCFSGNGFSHKISMFYVIAILHNLLAIEVPQELLPLYYNDLEY